VMWWNELSCPWRRYIHGQLWMRWWTLEFHFVTIWTFINFWSRPYTMDLVTYYNLLVFILRNWLSIGSSFLCDFTVLSIWKVSTKTLASYLRGLRFEPRSE
jgi:hypothetical protein